MRGAQLEQLGERIAEQAAHFDAAMHRLLTDLREFDQHGGWRDQGAASCAHWLAWRVGWDLVTARDRVRVARESTDSAEASGVDLTTSDAGAVAIGRVGALAGSLQFAGGRAGIAGSASIVLAEANKSGLVRMTGDSAEARGNTPMVALDRSAGVRRTGAAVGSSDVGKRVFSRADALVFIAQGYLRGDRPDRSPVEVVLTISGSSLREDAGRSNDAAEPAMDPLEVGDAGLTTVIDGTDSAPLSVGRKQRTIAGALNRALLQRDKCCTFPGCTNRLFLEGHHIKHWADGGETSLSNAALLCSLHHRYVHEYGYTVELGPDHRPRFHDQHGRLVSAVPAALTARASLGWSSIRSANAPLSIDAATYACEWDGQPVDYGRIVGHLCAADGLR